VRSAGAGRVGFSGRVVGRGVVTVLHAGGLRTTYEPVGAGPPVGSPVSAGTPIGRLERLGSHCAAQPCLHWGLLRGRVYLDPLGLVRRPDPPILLPLLR
jgi:murein DD-endopeptidase MepM/ murein hydrolase activator NlpD